MNDTFFKKIKHNIIMDAIHTNEQAKAKDVNRNHVNYGCLITWCQVAEEMGHKTNIPVWEDENGCLRIPFVEIDGEKTEYTNGK